MPEITDSRVSYFVEDSIKGITLPARFTFPFYYEPHPLTKLAAAELQVYLESKSDLDHNFGLSEGKEGLVIGKMFGVLVVQDKKGNLGYLSAFSGKLAGSNDHPKFVPPVFDMLVEDSFFLKEQEVINSINYQIEDILADERYHKIKLEVEELSAQSLRELSVLKEELKINKENRGKIRTQQMGIISEQDYTVLEAGLVDQSLHDHFRLKDAKRNWKEILDEKSSILERFETRIESLKNERKERSAALQQQLFEQYVFLNTKGQNKSLYEIFSPTAFGKPPSAAGECATPKLLQYAFAKGYKPLAMAEFWWGASPRSEIRKHKQFYPACTGKCKPILAHMLDGMEIDDNPFLQIDPLSSGLEIVYEDDCIVVVNKPAGLRSVPGIDVQDSVYTRLKLILLNTEPLIVHRLDMDTSGVLVVAKTRGAHKHIQKQFLDRTVSKRYTALLSGIIEEPEGIIDLPLIADPFNRPRQLVDFETGKNSVTKWRVNTRYETTTKVDFWPLTGRTHQLRMHSAHELGLNTPIVGDDIYGTASDRMYLHAAHIELIHPKTKEQISFSVPESF